ncbi:ester cyclase [Saccharopolyspora sp. K220]|uniref:ester cyclase n=1 Tax=Saccharopolyspora soli TaxID=2926618 RepID=UPI001F567998|nr:nuclear transport factor 2 family protein [Saccharopolyspora soli]MCI2416381.1 ester cyclase [Saccharopolyspora soli]
MGHRNSVEIVEAFWEAVWNGHDPDAVDRFVVEDFVITNAGEDIVGRENFKTWIAAFLDKVHDLELEVIETFQNEDGSRVASRWRLHGKNNGVLGTEPDGQQIAVTGTAVWAVREDGKLLHNWVERASWELFQKLTSA